ncbi:hypothetical protein RM609_03690 [Streptomyces sp. DSM 40473]|uniref:Uncharacterized protein n=1 Tax=Streptomyces hesseae TaxID=3075519 RepID=A0ABU2SH34_9ACTN|nr:hypothetical protein [Streptomyces sp. DSM 40473]MDT0448207.1 hypothetical protein [Streptomyces sp. DSM 40473]
MGAGEAGEPVPAGGQDGAFGGAGEQRADLVRVAHVVEDDQRLAVGRQGAEHRHAVHRRPGHGRAGDARAAQQLREERGGRAPGAARAVQVEEQLAVGEGVPQQVGEAGGQGGLADARGAGEDDHGRGRGRAAGRGGGRERAHGTRGGEFEQRGGA